MVEPSCAVVRTVMVFEPGTNEIDDDAAPEDTSTPFTFTVAVVSARVGITVVDLVPLETVAV